MEIAVTYMVAGLSSRFLGRPKGLAKVGPNNETLIEYSIDQAIQAGIKKIVLIVSEKTYQGFRQLLGDSHRGIPIHYAFQKFNPKERDKPWGTADALCSARQFLDGPFIVCNGDDIYGSKPFRLLADYLRKNKSNVTVGYELERVLSKEGPVNRGIFQVEDSEVRNIVETFGITRDNLREKNLSGETLCSMNIFGLQPETIDLLENSLKRFKKENIESRTAECLLPAEIGKLIADRRMKMYIYPVDSEWFGLTSPADEEIVRKKLKDIKK